MGSTKIKDCGYKVTMPRLVPWFLFNRSGRILTRLQGKVFVLPSRLFGASFVGDATLVASLSGLRNSCHVLDRKGRFCKNSDIFVRRLFSWNGVCAKHKESTVLVEYVNRLSCVSIETKTQMYMLSIRLLSFLEGDSSQKIPLSKNKQIVDATYICVLSGIQSIFGCRFFISRKENT